MSIGRNLILGQVGRGLRDIDSVNHIGISGDGFLRLLAKKRCLWDNLPRLGCALPREGNHRDSCCFVIHYGDRNQLASYKRQGSCGNLQMSVKICFRILKLINHNLLVNDYFHTIIRLNIEGIVLAILRL